MSEHIHQIGFLLFPNVTQLDFTGPAQILSRTPNSKTHFIAKSADPIPTDTGFSVLPTQTFATAPQLDVLIVPGGYGVVQVLEDQESLNFIAKQAKNARYICSVCNGSLILGAAGLLKGYKSACHWAWGHLLHHFGAEWVKERVVRDRNRFSGGGVTAGIDFALTLVTELADEEIAKRLQLVFEYDPSPPYDCGSPTKAGPTREAYLRQAMAQRAGDIEQIIKKITT
jgi:cyclohexyl-isocyanide hydratase